MRQQAAETKTEIRYNPNTQQQEARTTETGAGARAREARAAVAGRDMSDVAAAAKKTGPGSDETMPAQKPGESAAAYGGRLREWRKNKAAAAGRREAMAGGK